MDDNLVPDIEAIYRMVALCCAAMVTQHNKDHHAVMAIADAFLEYIDPLTAEQGIKFTLGTKLIPKS